VSAFAYPDLRTASHAGGRWYESPAGWMPSITTVLGATVSAEKAASLRAWRDGVGHAEADALTAAACDRGTAVHELAERYLQGEPLAALRAGWTGDPAHLASFVALRLKLDRIETVVAQEQAVWSPTFQVAGRFDCLGVWKGRLTLIDFKTATRVKGLDDIHDYEIQTTFYAAAHNELFGTDIRHAAILMSAADGFPLEFNIEFTDAHYEELSERAARFWREAIAAAG
jgi:genome maintenance exonuclease 1